MNQFDVIVIGGGPGGYAAAVRTRQLGLKTAVVEKEALGGVCVNWGCIPTKSLLRNAEAVHLLSQGRTFGFHAQDVSVDYGAAQKRSRQVSSRQARRVQNLLKTTGVEVFEGQGALLSPTEVEISPSGDWIKGRNLIIATGARPRQVPGIQTDGRRIITFRQALELTEPPESVVVVGAGPIGLEFATIWNRYGTQVTVVEMMPRVLPLEDEDISAEAARQFKRAKIDIRVETEVREASVTEDGVAVTLVQGDKTDTVTASIVLTAVGFVPNSGDPRVKEVGVRLDRDRIDIDGHMRTNIPGIYAVGDVTGKLGLAHAASAQAITAAEAIGGLDTEPLVYANIPRCTYTFPETASVGLTEAQALAQGVKAVSRQSPLIPNGKAVAMNENVGFIKIVADSETDRIQGVHMIGAHVTEIIGGAALALNMGVTVKEMGRTVYPHPTISEALMEGMHALSGGAIHL